MKCTSDVRKFYSSQSVQKAIELLGKAYNIYFDPVYTSYDSPRPRIDHVFSKYALNIDACGENVAIGFIRLSGEAVIYKPISKACGGMLDKGFSLMYNGAIDMESITRLIDAKDTLCYGAMNALVAENRFLLDKLIKISEIIDK